MRRSKQIVDFAKNFLCYPTFKIRRASVNILVISSLLLSGVSNGATVDVAAVAKEIYSAGNFDSMLLLSAGDFTAQDFHFAESVRNVTISIGKNFDDYIDATLAAINGTYIELSHLCMFTLLCRGDDIIEQIVRRSDANWRVCYMSLNESREHCNFMDISIRADDKLSHNFFAAKMKEYRVRAMLHEREQRMSLIRKVNELKRVQIHYVREPSAYAFPRKVRV